MASRGMINEDDDDGDDDYDYDYDYDDYDYDYDYDDIMICCSQTEEQCRCMFLTSFKRATLHHSSIPTIQERSATFQSI